MSEINYQKRLEIVVALCRQIAAEKYLLDPQRQEDLDLIDAWKASFADLPESKIIALPVTHIGMAD